MIVIDVSKFRRGFWIIAGLLMLTVIILLTYRSVQTNVSIVTGDEKYRDYTGLNGRLSYKLPYDWKTMEQNTGGNEITYHNSFSANDKKVNGFVEVWNLNRPLINFLKEGQKSFPDIVSLKNYTMEPIKIDGKDGYLIQYSKRDENNKYVKAFEVFILNKDTAVCRLAFYMNESIWKDEYRTFFLNIAATAKFR